MHWDGTFTLMTNTGFRTVNADDILFFCVQQNQVIAHTFDEEIFTGWYSLDKLWHAIRVSDSRFFRTDRLFIVNLSKIKKIDRFWNKIYFTENPLPGEKHCYVAKLKLPEVESLMSPQSLH